MYKIAENMTHGNIPQVIKQNNKLRPINKFRSLSTNGVCDILKEWKKLYPYVKQ